MKLPDLFRREKSSAKSSNAIARQDYAEKLLADGLRLLSRVFVRMADAVEHQRLQRKGFDRQGTWLERVDKPPPSDGRR